MMSTTPPVTPVLPTSAVPLTSSSVSIGAKINIILIEIVRNINDHLKATHLAGIFSCVGTRGPGPVMRPLRPQIRHLDLLATPAAASPLSSLSHSLLSREHTGQLVACKFLLYCKNNIQATPVQRIVVKAGLDCLHRCPVSSTSIIQGRASLLLLSQRHKLLVAVIWVVSCVLDKGPSPENSNHSSPWMWVVDRAEIGR